MKISFNWLKEYISFEQTPQELCDLLTSIGLEVGGMEKVESVKGGMEGLVTGEVISCKPHPNSDHLSKTTVDVGNGQILPIICGAPNVAAGQKVIVAVAGTVLYEGDQEFTIKKAKIRGEISEGMICSEIEIGVGSDSSGIMVLPGNVNAGTKAAEYFQIKTDWAIEVDITPNRIDSASHIGVARDLAAALKSSGCDGYLRPSVENFKVNNQNLDIPVEILDTDACPRYSGLTISGVNVAESPLWLQNRLKAIGLTPINNVVDVTNFVLFETGQPLHAFDADQIKGQKIVVRKIRSSTKFTTLDAAERKLDENDLMICNAEDAMCIGGVFGGLDSGVRITTRNIFLESACFDTVNIRQTARRHGLHTDASFRFERGTDINGTIYALKRAALLICEVAGGTISSEIKDVYPNPVIGFPVEVTFHNINRLIGKVIPKETVKNILSSLEISVQNETEKGMSLMVPAYRVDVKREADVIEEILRIYGYNNVEIPAHVNASLNYSEKPDRNKVKNNISDWLAAQGFHEMWSNSLTKIGYYEEITAFKPEQTVKIFNPLSSDLGGLRQTLLFGGLECIQLNTNRRNSDLRLFEFGNCYFYRGTKLKENPAANYYEEEHLSLFITGNREATNWTSTETLSSFHYLKSYAENLLKKLGFSADHLIISESLNEIFTEGLTYETPSKIKFLELGILSSEFTKKFDIVNLVYFADFSWDNLMLEYKKNQVKFTEMPNFPEVRRDLALLLDKDAKFASVKKIALHAEKQLLKAVNLFDVYEGNGVPEGKKSYAVSFILRDDYKTLTEKQIDKTMERLLTAFEKELGAKLR